MKSTLKIIILLSSILISINGKLIFKKIDCSADSEWICLKQCYVSETQALNVIGSIIKPLTNPFEIQFTLSKLDGSTSTLVFDTQIEWCSFMNGNGNNPIFTQLVAIIKNVLPKLIHECPYCGDFEVKNLKFDEAMNLAASAFFPIGELKVETGFTFGDVNFKTITCKSDNVLNSIQECSISSKGSLNIAGKFLKTLENPVVDFKISKNESSKYKLVVQNKLEWCAFVSEKGNYEMISTSMLKTSFATLFHDCPYFGKYEVIDFTMPKKMDVILSGILAEGNYKLELYIYENNSTIVDLEMTFEITSLLSDIFGE